MPNLTLTFTRQEGDSILLHAESAAGAGHGAFALPFDGETLLEALSRIYTLYGLNTPTARQEAVANENEELPRIVCSMGLVSTADTP